MYVISSKADFGELWKPLFQVPITLILQLVNRIMIPSFSLKIHYKYQYISDK